MNVNKKGQSKCPSKALSRQERVIFCEVEKAMRKKKVYRNRTLSLDSLAKVLGVHRNTLSRVVNLCSGKNFNRYINSYRVSEAVKLIAENSQIELKVQTIGKMVGFASRTPFYSALKEFYGLTATEIRAQAQENDELN